MFGPGHVLRGVCAGPAGMAGTILLEKGRAFAPGGLYMDFDKGAVY